MRAVVPARTFARAKSRLTPALSGEERASLAEAMLAHVVGILAASGAVDSTLVVADDEGVAACARGLGAEAMVHAPGLGPSVAAAVARVRADGDAVFVAMADLIALSVEDVRAMICASDGGRLALAPDRHEDGTSALVSPAGMNVRTRFGERGSFALHTGDARAAGVATVVVRRPGLALDIDLPEDLALAGISVAAVRAAGSARPGSWTESSRTSLPRR